MMLSFRQLDQAAAMKIASWSYPKPYDIYRFDSQGLEFTDSIFGVFNDDDLIAYRSFGGDGRVPGWEYSDSHLDTGGGLRPDLTGKGLGQEIIRAGLLFGSNLHATSRFRVTIADFNQRAQTVCHRIGFREIGTFNRPSDNLPFSVLTIDLIGDNARQ